MIGPNFSSAPERCYSLLAGYTSRHGLLRNALDVIMDPWSAGIAAAISPHAFKLTLDLAKFDPNLAKSSRSAMRNEGHRGSKKVRYGANAAVD